MTTRGARLRISLAVLLVFAVVAVFVVRLVDIQLVHAEEYNSESHDKRARTLVTYGERGDIVDANGAVLADSVLRYDITASPRVALMRKDAATSIPSELTRIAEITGQDPAVMLTDFLADPESDFTYVSKGLTLEQYEAVVALEIPWTSAERRPSRTYPNGQIAANLVGFIGTDGAQAGVELTENDCLASTDGTATYESAEDGTQLPGSVITTQEPKDGGTLRLTIDRDLQFFVQQRMEQTAMELGATWATGVVMRVSDGHLMAVSDWPTFDANDINNAPRDANGERALGSRAFSTPYEPGSTMKAVTAASLIDAGVATPATQVVSPFRLLQDDGTYINDSFQHATLNLTLAGTLVESSNTAIAQLTDLLPAQQRHDYMTAFGLGSKTEVQFNGESRGQVLPADEWYGRTNYAVQFGQGMSATSVQMASVYQAFANGGVRTPVVLVEGCEHADGTVTDTPPTEGTRVISESTAKQVSEMLEQVANHAGGYRNTQIPGYRTAVKSGTAQVAREDGSGYGDAVVLSYAGFAPADDPQYVVVVTAGIPNKMYSGRIAATWGDVMAQTLTSFRVQPSTSPAPELPLRW
jgi:cell division protein FtsI (penicillin-binding protein 3)